MSKRANKGSLSIEKKISRFKELESILDTENHSNITTLVRKIIKFTEVSLVLKGNNVVHMKDGVWWWNKKFKITRDFVNKIWSEAQDVQNSYREKSSVKKTKPTVNPQAEKQVSNHEEMPPENQDENIVRIFIGLTESIAELRSDLDSIKAHSFDTSTFMKKVDARLSIFESGPEEQNVVQFPNEKIG